MENQPLQKIAISGPTLASMMQRISSSLGDVDGLLFGHVTYITPSTLSDDSPTQAPSNPDSHSPQLVATITSFLSPSSSPLSFYDAQGRLHSPSLLRLLRSSSSSSSGHNHHFLGWFYARRKTHIRPSIREFSVSRSLSAAPHLSFPIKTAAEYVPVTAFLTPCVFLLFATPLQDQFIHTHEYRAYQFRDSTVSFEPKPIDVVNIGPAFRGHYGNFSPTSPFPMLNCELRSSTTMNEDRREEEEDEQEKQLMGLKRASKDQKELEKLCGEGFSVGNLRRLMGSDAANYTAGLEDLYEKMLAKIDTLAREVEKSNAKVLEQENHNRKLRHRVARGCPE